MKSNEVLNIAWLEANNVFKKVASGFKTLQAIPKGVYDIGFNPGEGWFLTRTVDSFSFNYKVYGLESEFCDHVIKTFLNTKGNLGVLLNGIKGTGKTVTAKVLANKLNLPVIIVKDMGGMNQDMIEFLNGFNFDAVLFLDEFEKNFSQNDSTILQIMDGVYSIGYRKVFLLTTNELRVNENLLGRPSRIRYVKKFSNLSLDIVKEYLNDNLINKEYTNDLINYIDTLKYSTIDILKSVVEEVNIHGIDVFGKIKDTFNVTMIEFRYCCLRACVRDLEILSNPEKKKKYSVENFLEDVNKYNNPVLPPIWLGKIRQDDWTEDQQKEYDDWKENKESVFGGISYCSCTSSINFFKLKPGDEFDGGIIKFIDTERNVIITLFEPDYDDNAWINFYHISNSETSPSLYNNNTLTY